MPDELLDHSLIQYYESMPTPVLYFLHDKIIWHNSAGERAAHSRELCGELLRCSIPNKEQPVKISVKNANYFLLLRPWKEGMFVEVMDISTLGSICAKQISIDASYAIDHTVRDNAHRIFHAVDVLRPTLETSEKYDELNQLDAIFSGSHRILRASDLYKAYIDLFHRPMNPVNADIMQDFEALFSYSKVILHHHDIPFSWELSQPHLFCRVDVNRLTFAVLHLISNAFYFTAPGNDVKVEVFVGKGNYFKICVHDKGVGFTPSGLEHAVEPFYSYDPNTGDAAGCGLGLTFANAFAKQCGGTCAITSGNHKTVVMLTIPYEPIEMNMLHSVRKEFPLGKFSPAAVVLSSVAPASWIS